MDFPHQTKANCVIIQNVHEIISEFFTRWKKYFDELINTYGLILENQKYNLIPKNNESIINDQFHRMNRKYVRRLELFLSEMLLLSNLMSKEYKNFDIAKKKLQNSLLTLNKSLLTQFFQNQDTQINQFINQAQNQIDDIETKFQIINSFQFDFDIYSQNFDISKQII